LKWIDSRAAPVGSGLQPGFDYRAVGGWDLPFGRHFARLNSLPEKAFEGRSVLGFTADCHVGEGKVEFTRWLGSGMTAQAIASQYQFDGRLIDLRGRIGLGQGCEK
jgi:hypothetical protein